MPEKRLKKRDRIDRINERYMRIQQDLVYISKELKGLDRPARNAFRKELAGTVGQMVKDLFGEG